MSSVAGECVGGWLTHKVCEWRLKVSLETLPLPLARWFCFQPRKHSGQAARTPIRACGLGRSSNMINAILLEEERGRAGIDWGAHAPRVLAMAPRRRELLFLY